jgi:hypothetical protein
MEDDHRVTFELPARHLGKAISYVETIRVSPDRGDGRHGLQLGQKRDGSHIACMEDVIHVFQEGK